MVERMGLRSLLTLLLFVVHGAAYATGRDVALVTVLQGRVVRIVNVVSPGSAGQSPQRQSLQSYAKLKQGDQLTLDKDSRLQLVYFDSGRMETWRGSGRLEISSAASQAFGLPEPQLRVLSAVMVSQLSRMPADDNQGGTRFRSIATPDAIAGIENTYRRLRNETTDRSDLNPELYLLSGMFEVREFGRVEQVLSELQRERGSDSQVKLLASLYQRAMRNSRQAKGN
ncbi:MAG: hypothetical protein PHQ05_08350 [Sterolibacterium sp.]|nr:hypothetical protein [Sterolibacterium sp.]